MEAAQKVRMKLTVEGQRSFLQHALKRIEWVSPNSSNFINFLTISKQYLVTARYYSTFHFALRCIEESKFGASFCSSFRYTYNHLIRMPLEYLRKFISFINPSRLMVYVDNNMTDEMINETGEIMRGCKGKISIQGAFQNEEGFNPMLKEFAGRLYELRHCTQLLMDDKSMVSKLNLDNYEDHISRTIDKFEFILRSVKAKKIIIYVPRVDPPETTLTDLPSHNYAIREFTLHFGESAEETMSKFTPLVLNMLKYCPNLQKFNCNMMFSEYAMDDFDTNRVVKQALDYYKFYCELKNKLSHSPAIILSLYFTVYCSLEQYDNSWKNQLKEYAGFENAHDGIKNYENSSENYLRIMETSEKFNGDFTVNVMC